MADWHEMEEDDGSVLQAGLNVASVYDDADAVTLNLYGVVWSVHYPDDQDNLSKESVEYTVLLATRTFMRNVRSVYSHNGYNTGLDLVLKPTGKTTSTGGRVDPDATPFEDMDGDHVILQSLYGRGSQLVITQKLPHPRSTIKPTRKADGARCLFVYQGIRFLVSSSGVFTIEIEPSDSVTNRSRIEIKGGEMNLYQKNVTVHLEDGKVSMAAGSTSVSLDGSNVTAKKSGVPHFLVTKEYKDALNTFFQALELIVSNPAYPALAPLFVPVEAFNTTSALLTQETSIFKAE